MTEQAAGSSDAMRRAAFAQFADYDAATGGYIYNATIVDRLRALGWQVDDLAWPAGFPEPSPAGLTAMGARLGALPDGTPVLVDQVCLSRLPEIARQEARRLRWVEIFHHPMVHDLPADDPRRPAVEASERATLGVAALVLASSETTARWLVESEGLESERLVTALPGLPRFPRRPAERRPGPLRLLSVGAVVPRKDYLGLVAALAGLERLGAWRLDIVGNTGRDPAYAADLVAAIARLGLAERVAVRGQLADADLAELWAAADVYVAASRHEGYGMAIAEALGRGLPIVTTSAGAVAEWLDPESALIVPSGDRVALRAALARVLASDGDRAALSAAAARAAQSRPTWEESAGIVAAALSRLVGQSR
jgi:glycosyltransferase involved in cell wall biosynthesis